MHQVTGKKQPVDTNLSQLQQLQTLQQQMQAQLLSFQPK